MRPANRPLPILDNKAFECVVKEAKLPAGKHVEHVAIETPKDCIEMASRRRPGRLADQVPQVFVEGSRPVSQHRRCSTADRNRGIEIGRDKRQSFPAQSVLFFQGASKHDQPQ